MQQIDFRFIEAIKGVEQYIVTDEHSRIIENYNIDRPDKMAELVSSCCKNFHAIGKTNFKYAVFKKKDLKHFIVLPLGEHFIGLIKHETVDSFTIIEAIFDFADTFNIRR